MIFIASLCPIEEKDCIKKSIGNNDGFFLLRDMITNKKWWRDDKLEHMYNLMRYYIHWYTESVYCYLMTDNYFYKTDLANSYHPSIPDTKVGQCGLIVGIPRMPNNLNDYKDSKYKYIHEYMIDEECVFSHNDIDGIFAQFEENNFRQNPCCCVHLCKEVINIGL